MGQFDSVKVFSATMREHREKLGDEITSWLRAPAQRGIVMVDKVVTQSSDSEFHCLAITIFYKRAT